MMAIIEHHSENTEKIYFKKIRKLEFSIVSFFIKFY